MANVGERGNNLMILPTWLIRVRQNVETARNLYDNVYNTVRGMACHDLPDLINPLNELCSTNFLFVSALA